MINNGLQQARIIDFTGRGGRGGGCFLVPEVLTLGGGVTL